MHLEGSNKQVLSSEFWQALRLHSSGGAFLAIKHIWLRELLSTIFTQSSALLNRFTQRSHNQQCVLESL